MQRAAAASGGVSGGGILAMGERAQETAGAGFETQYNRLGELIRTGQSAAAGVAGAGQNFANHAGDITMKGAETRGNLSMAETGVTTGAVNQIANTGMQAYGADEQRRKFDSWTRPQPSQQQSQLQQQEAGLTTPMNNFNWSY